MVWAALVVNACCSFSNNLMSAPFRTGNSTLMASGFFWSELF